MNKRGTTLVEVIISIVLISVVLMFMIKLLIDLNNTEANNDYAKDNQITRAEIIRTIENDIRTKEISSISASRSTATNLVLEFTFRDSTTAVIDCESTTLVYTSTEGDVRRWTMDQGNIYVNRADVYYQAPDSPEAGDLYVLQIDIEIHTSNDNNTVDNNNTLDDFIISHVGPAANFSNIGNCLGYCCNNAC